MMAAQLAKEQAEAAIVKVVSVLEEEATKAKLLAIVEEVSKLPAEQQQMAKMAQLLPAVQEATAPVMAEYGYQAGSGMAFTMQQQQHAAVSPTAKEPSQPQRTMPQRTKRHHVRRRLRSLRTHLAAAVEQQPLTAVLGGQLVELVPHDQPRQHSDSVSAFPRTDDGRWTAALSPKGQPLLQDGSGVVLASELARLEEEKAVAIAAEDFRAAAAVKSIISVVTPRPTPLPLPLESYVTGPDFTPADVEAAAVFFLEHGFCVVPGAVSDGTLSRVRQFWMPAEQDAQELWQQRSAVSQGRYGLSWASGAPSGFRTFFDLGLSPEPGGNHWDLASALIEVAAQPGLLLVAKLVLGGGATVGGFPGGRVVPPEDQVPGPEPGTTGGDGGYTSWHRDSPPPDGWPTPHSRRVKAFCSFWDTPANGGSTAVVPGSHRTPAGPKDTLSRKFTGGGFVHSERPPDGEGMAMDSMVNHVPLALQAGVITLIDQAVWHCALPNTTDQPRRNVIFGLSGEDGGGGGGPARMALEAAVEENIAAGFMTPQQRECFGL